MHVTERPEGLHHALPPRRSKLRGRASVSSAPRWRRQKCREHRRHVWIGHHVQRDDLAVGEATVTVAAGLHHAPVQEGSAMVEAGHHNVPFGSTKATNRVRHLVQTALATKRVRIPHPEARPT